MLDRASILIKTGIFLDQRAFYNRSKSRTTESLQLRESILGPEDQSTLNYVQSLALTLRHGGKLDQAEEMCKRALTARELQNGKRIQPQHLLYMISVFLGIFGRWGEARFVHGRTLNIPKEALGEFHALTTVSLLANSAVLWHEGQNEKAEELNIQATEILGKTLGECHPQTLTAVNNMGNTLWMNGKLESAEILYQEVIEAREGILGLAHSDTFITHSNLGSLH
ncbi:hypothetical protein CC78DRAFT_608666 [Lojkania enalia]|uniref:Kinesin light chain n=1 Tax=Lojkania enalia TaxID=147567 RepID=A0A9P4K264_9PLEO|nr:hypothetical protein CC78DRAFT_608666 [Didymosphaeria enalia]